ncbi:MAG: alpha-galactosidase [Lachnospiraceae bacterium]|nr:alpha-galactosidase [Lachnospiraceae bacterium]
MSIEVYQERLFTLQTAHTSYVFCINEQGIAENLYWGKKIQRTEDFADVSTQHVFVNVNGPQSIQEECSSYGSMRYKETSLRLQFFDGVDDFRYRGCEYKIDGNVLEIVLKDIFYSFSVHLFYQVFEEEDIIKKWRVAENTGKEPVILDRIYSGEFGLFGSGYRAINYNGRWGAEFLREEDSITYGKKVYESLYGLSGHTVNPAFIVHRDGTETTGEVYYGVLEYSGDFKTVIEAVNCGYLNILIGINDTDFQWKLAGGESFTTPAVYGGYSDQGFQEMTHCLTRLSRNYLMPKKKANQVLPVLYNSWYATLFDVKCDEQIALARKAADTGVELFVIDDGWFTGRKNDKAGLGDWFVDREKFPQGLEPLIRVVNELGMKFGVWIEPEMVNPDSDLYREHPEWIYCYKNREVLMGRNQYMLDMTNGEVIDYLTQIFHKLLSENKIDYIKWDMNRYAAERGSASLPKEEWQTIAWRNTQGVYTLIERLRSRHPEVEFEACASGGARVDYGAMRYFDEYWPSDNTDPLDRLMIQESYSYLYPVKYMRAWLTDDFGMNRRKIPLAFSMHSAMCGSLGIGVNLNQISEEDKEQIADYVQQYKEVRATIQMGELYRLQSLQDGDLQALCYNDEDRSVLFVFLDHQRYGATCHEVKLRGLCEDALYRYKIEETEAVKSGAYLMQQGILLKLQGDYDSRMIILEKQK